MNFLTSGYAPAEIQKTYYKELGRVLTQGHFVPITKSQRFELSEDSLSANGDRKSCYKAGCEDLMEICT